MRPRLYAPEATVFDSNGIGALSDAVSCKAYSAFGEDEIALEYPLMGIHFSEITMRSILVVKPDPFRAPQAYRVYKITKPMSGLVKIYARHIAYDLMGIVVNPFQASSAALALRGFQDFAVTECPFVFVTDKSTEGNFSVVAPSSIWSKMGGSEGSILDIYGGEFQFDNYTINLWNRLGSDRGVSIRYGKNLTCLEQDSNCAGCYTGVSPYWVNSETGTVKLLPGNVLHAAGDYGYTRILPLDLSEYFETEPTEDQMRSRAEKYMTDNKIGEPTVSWKVEFVQLEQTVEYKGMALLERVCLGDTVHVEFPQMGVSVAARAVSAEYNCLMERYESITLGSVKQTLADTIVKQKQEIEKKTGTDALQRAATIATKALLDARGGSVQTLDTDGDGKDDTIYIADSADPALAQKVWRWNYEGWAASKTGYNGPFTMAATLEAGLLADFVTAAHLVAGTIESKNGAFFMDLDSGTIRFNTIDDSLQQLNEAVAGVNEDMQEKFNTIAKFFSFGVDGLTIGEVNSPYKIVIDNDELIIMANDTVVQRFDSEGRSLIPELNVTRMLTLLGYQITRDSDGNVNCHYVGGE